MYIPDSTTVILYKEMLRLRTTTQQKPTYPRISIHFTHVWTFLNIIYNADTILLLARF